jgi:aminoglycoside phosphotransferase (APT) family kinase protein
VIAIADRTEAVDAALRDAGELGDGDEVRTLEQLPGGWSRHSFVAHAARAGGGGRRYIVRVKPAGALLDTDLALEYRVYAALAGTGLPTPRVFAFADSEDTPFGGPFIVMEHVDGTAPNMYNREDQARLAEDWAGPRTIAADMVENLARIHGLSDEELPADLPDLGFDDVVARWRSVYEDRHLVRDPVVEEAFDWVAQRAPDAPWPGLVHGDYRIGNTLIADGRVRAILDWELVHRGDVRFDLGYLAMARAAGKHLRARSPLMGTFAEQDWFLERYAQLTGRHVDREVLRTFEMLGIMMLLATQFTAVWMYANGRTTDVRMAWSRFSFAGLRQDMTRLMAW